MKALHFQSISEKIKKDLTLPFAYNTSEGKMKFVADFAVFGVKLAFMYDCRDASCYYNINYRYVSYFNTLPILGTGDNPWKQSRQS